VSALQLEDYGHDGGATLDDTFGCEPPPGTADRLTPLAQVRIENP
jgi:hypothetical protein